MTGRAGLSLLAGLCLAAAVQPAWGQVNALDIHLDHQLWTRLHNHQIQPQLDASKPVPSSADAQLVERLNGHLPALEAAIPQGRRIGIDTEGVVHIEVAGPVDEAAVIALAEELLQARVVVDIIAE